MSPQVPPKKGTEVVMPPTDSISELAFSKTRDLLAASSWDNEVRVWDVNSDGTTAPVIRYAHKGPVLSCHWNKDGTKLASGGADKIGQVLDANTGQPAQFAVHEAPIKTVRWLDELNIVATGSWDKTIKYWDLRSNSPISSVGLSNRCHSLDTRDSFLVCATIDRMVTIFDLTNPTVAHKAHEAAKIQSRVVACFTQGPPGFALGLVEGRTMIEYFEDKDQACNFGFKCHRDGRDIYAVNSIAFHPVLGTFGTAGSDGSVIFWDKDSKQKLGEGSIPKQNAPITATAFNSTGSIFAYAVSYDWSMGYAEAPKNHKDIIKLAAFGPEDFKPRKK
ncbi:MAG: WD40-repeat-containing domain protein [Podila humilis]|nr:MAG: WD40-repeat-containing domain protein [Podila humilis]